MACDALASSDSKHYARSTCGPLNDAIRRGEAVGQHVIFQGFNTERQQDGTITPNGWLTTVTANFDSIDESYNNPARAAASSMEFTQLPAGASFRNADLASVRYTEYGASLLPSMVD